MDRESTPAIVNEQDARFEVRIDFEQVEANLHSAPALEISALLRHEVAMVDHGTTARSVLDQVNLLGPLEVHVKRFWQWKPRVDPADDHSIPIVAHCLQRGALRQR